MKRAILPSFPQQPKKEEGLSIASTLKTVLIFVGLAASVHLIYNAYFFLQRYN